MNPESLQTLGVLAIGLGFVLIGLGGFTTYTASQKVQHRAELREVEEKGELNAQILTLMMKNQELAQRAAAPATPAPATPVPEPQYYHPPSPPPPPVTHRAAQEPMEGPAEATGRAREEEQRESAMEGPLPEGGAAAEPQVEVRPGRSDWEEPSSFEASGRYLSGRQRQVIAETLRAHGRHTVTIESSYGEDVSRAFAEELGAAFAEADWVVRGIDEHRGLPLAAGVTVSAASFPPQPETRAVYEALLSAGIAVTQQLDPKQRQSETVVLVGSPL